MQIPKHLDAQDPPFSFSLASACFGTRRFFHALKEPMTINSSKPSVMERLIRILAKRIVFALSEESALDKPSQTVAENGHPSDASRKNF